MAGGPKPQIALQEVGGVTLISSERANELIVVLNALLNATMNPQQNVGSIMYSPNGMIWDLSALVQRVSTLEQVTGVDSNTNSSADANSIQNQINNINNSLTVINNSLTSINSSISSVSSNVSQIVTSLTEATINATCDNAGGIDITLTIPNLP